MIEVQGLGPWRGLGRRPGLAAVLGAVHAASFPPEDAWSEQAFAVQLGLPGVFARAAEGGVVLARVTADEAEILTLAVHPEARRRGVALRLLAEAEAEAAERGAAWMFLEVAQANAPARALYSRAGYVQAGLRPAYYRDGGDALLLRRTL